MSKTKMKKATSPRAITNAHQRAGVKKKEEKQSCFVIMPFGGWYDQYYDDIYRPAIEEAGLISQRADDLYRPGTIVNDIWQMTQSAKVILADLSGKNPNVFYELGLAHALVKPAILVTESIEQVPFDLRALRVLEYDKNEPDWGRLLKEKLARSIEEVIKAPLDAVLPAFLKVDRSSKPATVSEQEKILLDLKRDIDMLKSEMRSGTSRYSYQLRNAAEAIPVFDRYIKMGMPERMIIEKLTQRGVPEKWVKDRIMEKKEGSGQLLFSDTSTGSTDPSST